MKSIFSAVICSLSLLAMPAHADELMDTARELFEAIPTEAAALTTLIELGTINVRQTLVPKTERP